MEIHYSELKDIKPTELVKKIGLRIKSDNVILEIRGSGGKDKGNNLLILCKCDECGLERAIQKANLVRGRGCGCVSGSGRGATEKNLRMIGTVVENDKRHLKILDYNTTVRLDGKVVVPPHFIVKCFRCEREFEMSVNGFNTGFGCGCTTGVGYGATEKNKSLVGTCIREPKRNLKILTYHKGSLVDDCLRPAGYDVVCLDCKREFYIAAANLRKGDSCGCIRGAGGGGTRMNRKLIGKTFEESNRRITILDYHKRGTLSCGTKVSNRYAVECLDCGRHFNMNVASFRNGSGGCICRTMSNAESLMMSLLEENNIDYTFDSPFTWSKRKRYDFHLPRFNAIVELHGKQHYTDVKYWNSTAEQQRKNDKFKRELAKNNGIDHYYEVNCSNRAREDVIKSLKDTLPENILRVIFPEDY